MTDHRVVGDLDLHFETVPLPSDAGQKLLIYTAEPQSRSQAALNLLASWNTSVPTPAAKSQMVPGAGPSSADPANSP